MATNQPSTSARPFVEGITLIETVEFTVKATDRTWSVPQIYERLQEAGFEFESSMPKNTIATAISRLVERGEVVLVKKGSGRRPNEYKARRWTSPAEEVKKPSDIWTAAGSSLDAYVRIKQERLWGSLAAPRGIGEPMYTTFTADRFIPILRRPPPWGQVSVF